MLLEKKRKNNVVLLWASFFEVNFPICLLVGITKSFTMRPLGSVLVVTLASSLVFHVFNFGVSASLIFTEYLLFVLFIFYIKRNVPFDFFRSDFIFYGGGCLIITAGLVFLSVYSVFTGEIFTLKLPSILAFIQSFLINTSLCTGNDGNNIGDTGVVIVSTVASSFATGCSTDWCLKFFQAPSNLLKPKTHKSVVYLGLLSGAFLGYKMDEALIAKK